MEILFVLIPLSLVLLGVAVWAFFWAVRTGQFEDLDSPAYRILMDDDERPDDAPSRPSDGPAADDADKEGGGEQARSGSDR